ncbi:MAG: stress-induced protein [Phenylobacterium sp.]|uniref:stress-induced protein n=1 Tax=Phenylobacterium sp. TaxID=1871053 RepID=UPI00271AADCB|nr:stress-induced protein [Phenylobacterium sp.]MDO8913991.1 stress-induced protein [Phenylobacterium sp.]MDP3100326.1 stress-induced protein [Phenylobacterium sp.]
MSPERRRTIAIKGGASVPAEKRSFSINRDLAKDAGRKGGSAEANKYKPTDEPPKEPTRRRRPF